MVLSAPSPFKPAWRNTIPYPMRFAQWFRIFSHNRSGIIILCPNWYIFRCLDTATHGVAQYQRSGTKPPVWLSKYVKRTASRE
jgi:hypothetical protein